MIILLLPLVFRIAISLYVLTEEILMPETSLSSDLNLIASSWLATPLGHSTLLLEQ